MNNAPKKTIPGFVATLIAESSLRELTHQLFDIDVDQAQFLYPPEGWESAEVRDRSTGYVAFSNGYSHIEWDGEREQWDIMPADVDGWEYDGSINALRGTDYEGDEYYATHDETGLWTLAYYEDGTPVAVVETAVLERIDQHDRFGHWVANWAREAGYKVA